MAANLLSMPQGAAQLPLGGLDKLATSTIPPRALTSPTIVDTPPASVLTATASGKRLRVAELFAGVGGLTLGAARAGFEVVLAVEKDPDAMKAHKLNFPKVCHSDADISKLDGAALLAAAGLKAGELDGLIGGPPCQGFSVIGVHEIADPRNNLFHKFFGLVAETKPKFFVAENVLGILKSKHDATREGALDLVRAQYHLLPPMKFKACDFGAPTVRERVFFVGCRKRARISLAEADFQARKVEITPTVKEALFGLPAIENHWLTEEQGWRRVSELPTGDYATKIRESIPEGVGDEQSLLRLRKKQLVSGCLGTLHTDALRARYAALLPGKQDSISKSIRLRNDGLCPTLRAGTGSDKGSYQAVRPIHPTESRVITPREAARLQGFPDWFQFAPSKWHSFRQIGNSVSPFVAEAVMSVIHSALSPQQATNR